MQGDYKIIVIGASTGGIDALRVVLGNIPRNIKAAICVCQHIDRSARLDYKILFSDVSDFQVLEAEDKQWLRPGSIYFAPPGYHLYVEPEGYLGLSVDTPVNWSRPSIDVLFESAARAMRERVIGVVLTGANSDGVQGVREIKRLGGYCIAQNPDSALAGVMPKVAIETGCIDTVLELQDIASMLTLKAGIELLMLKEVKAL